MANKTYSEKLKDPRWQKKRLQILERDNFSCRLCHDPHSTLHIHHERYNGEPWEANDFDLITYCKHCHSIAEHVKEYFVNYSISEVWKGTHATQTEIISFVVLGFCHKPEEHRLVLIFKFEGDDAVLVTHLYPYQVFRLHELTMKGTYSIEKEA